uniref:Uncharacterized protein n=1 Tax=Sphaerodactylus townsendi TaxID=933632 RepID=A0ACB8G1A3_9SAUR
MPGMELGHHGRPGPPAALPVGLAFRSVRGRAATLLRDTEAGSVSDKAERSGSAMRTVLAHYPFSGLHGALGLNVVPIVVEGCTQGRGHVKMETPVLAVLWNIKPVAQRPAQKYEGIRPGPPGCPPILPRVVPARSNASATPAVLSFLTLTISSLAERRQKVGSAQTMARPFATLIVRPSCL